MNKCPHCGNETASDFCTVCAKSIFDERTDSKDTMSTSSSLTSSSALNYTGLFSSNYNTVLFSSNTKQSPEINVDDDNIEPLDFTEIYENEKIPETTTNESFEDSNTTEILSQISKENSKKTKTQPPQQQSFLHQNNGNQYMQQRNAPPKLYNTPSNPFNKYDPNFNFQENKPKRNTAALIIPVIFFVLFMLSVYIIATLNY